MRRVTRGENNISDNCRRKDRGVSMEGLKELVEYGVIGLLLGLSLWAIGVAVERWLFYRRWT